jgi:hypothetical protein
MARKPGRPRSHVVGDVGRTFVKLLFEEWGWTADIVQSDYGEDLDCSVFTGGRRTSLHFRCQVKATANPKRKRGGEYAVTVNASTCAAWIQSYYPVFLVLYDGRAKEAYFVNAVAILRKNPNALTRRYVSFTIPRNAQLRLSRDILLKHVQDHYAEFLRVSDSVQCLAFPVLMPKYRMALPRTEFAIEGWDWEHRHRDRLPAWTTVFETMDSEYLYGIERDFAAANLDEVYADLTTGLKTSSVVENPGHWLALSCCPIRFKASQWEEPNIWTGELTGWRSFALIEERVVDDRQYAFAPPSGFMTEVARHTLSWDDYYHVDPDRDVAIQLYAAVPLTPAYRDRSKSMRSNAAGQLLPWSCPPARRADLQAMLSPSGLTFSSIDELSTAEKVVGVIHSPMFVVEDGFTSIPMARDWDTFDQGAVRKIINGLPVGTLPGSEAGPDVLEHALNQVPNLALDPPEKFYGVQHDTPMGLPVNLADRRIVVERFHALAGSFDETICDNVAADIQRKLSEACPSLARAAVSFAAYNTDMYPMVRLALSWHPPLGLSSADAFLEVESAVLQEFDRVLPRRAPSWRWASRNL